MTKRMAPTDSTALMVTKTPNFPLRRKGIKKERSMKRGDSDDEQCQERWISTVASMTLLANNL